MLLCPVDELEPGMELGAAVLHPERAGMELLRAGTTLDERIIKRLVDFDVREAWVHYAGTEDIEPEDLEHLTAAQRGTLKQISQGLGKRSRGAVSGASIARCADAVAGFLNTVASSRHTAALATRLHDSDEPVFAHSVNVASLALLIAMNIEQYIIDERRIADSARAKDLHALGLAAMLHDVGKLDLPPAEQRCHEAEAHLSDAELSGAYLEHTLRGYRMLDSGEMPPAARHAILMHHQRFDGSGWPGADALPASITETPAGHSLHVFARVLALANAAENLLERAERARQPPVVALAELFSERLGGWFDPVIAGAAQRTLIPFPPGTKLELSDGTPAVVAQPNRDDPCRPIVRPLGGDAEASAPVIDLAASSLTIARAGGVDVAGSLYEPLGLTRGRLAA